MTSFQRVILVLAGLMLGAGIGGAPYLSRLRAIEQRAQISINNPFIIADVARSGLEQAVGLSGRTVLNVNEGMLFLFDEPDSYGFWMKDMTFPIDIVWINGDKIVGVTERVFPPPEGTPPEAMKIHYPPEPVDRVLELVAGRVKLLRAGPGATVEIRPFVPRVR